MEGVHIFAWQAPQLLAENEKQQQGHKGCCCLGINNEINVVGIFHGRVPASNCLFLPLDQPPAPSTLLLLWPPAHPAPLSHRLFLLSLSPRLLSALLPPSYTTQHLSYCFFLLFFSAVLNQPSFSLLPHFTCFMSIHLHVCHPGLSSQAVSSMISAGGAPKEQAASCFPLHS